MSDDSLAMVSLRLRQQKPTNLFNDLYLAVEARGATFYQGHAGSETHAIDVAACSKIVKRIEYYVETSEPLDIELGVHDIRVICLKLCAWLKSLRNIFRNL